ncbi:SRPBCC family protein [Amycolatopsis sp. WGS_07]|uniref:SRPBCC family protein n=1 Tax=Amycolatopsis sp. WGS_07 TaxID=3076764 RepID=UPI0038736087
MRELFTTDVRVEVAASAEQVRAAVLDLSTWPQVHLRTVHVEYREKHENEDLVEIWTGTGDGLVKSRRIRRRWAPDSARIEFAHETGDGREDGMRGCWTVEPRPDGTTLAGMLHEFTVAEDAMATTGDLVTSLERGSRDFLGALKHAVENRAEIVRLTTTVRSSGFVAGPARTAYDFLARRGSDVGPAIAGGPPGPALARVLVPPNRIAYKQLRLPETVEAHVGRWTLTENQGGVLVRADQVVRFAPDAAETREELRKTLTAEQADRLHAVKAHVESLTGSR